MTPTSFFQDLVVVELSSVLAGPAVGMFFSELGAHVIKIENGRTGGDVTRTWKLPKEPKDQPYSAYYHSVNWGKETHIKDLQTSADRQETLVLLQKADVVITNFKVGAAEALGMDYPSLKALNPRLIYASVTAYGYNDSRPGFDAMIQAETGWVFMNGEPEGEPVKLPVALMDLLAGHQLKEGILLALLERARTGQGRHVSVSLFDTGIASLANQASNWLNAEVLPQRKGSRHPNIAPYGDLFYTQDRRLIMLGIGTQRQFERLCEGIGVPELKDDPRFTTNALRLAHRADLNAGLKQAFQQISFDQLVASGQALGFTLAPVNNLQEVFELPAAKDLILTQEEIDGQVSLRVKTVVFQFLES